MNVKKLSPVAEFLRANHAKAKNIRVYRDYPTGVPVKYCEFYDPNGNYLGKMSRSAGKIGKTPSFALLKSYIETLEPGYKAGYRQVTENVINFDKILGLNTEKTTYLPEKIVKKRTIIDNQGYKTEDIFERTISSKLKLIEKGDDKAYGYVPQNTYLAEEPIRYQETQTVHNRIKSDTF